MIKEIKNEELKSAFIQVAKYLRHGFDLEVENLDDDLAFILKIKKSVVSRSQQSVMYESKEDYFHDKNILSNILASMVA